MSRPYDPEKPALEQLTPQERAFLTNYAMTGKLVQSFRKAGYQSALGKAEAKKMLKRPKLKKAFEEILIRPLDELQANMLRIVREVAHVAFSDIEEVFDEEGNVLPAHQMPESARRAVSSMKLTRTYHRHKDGTSDCEVSREVKLWSKPQALEMFFKYYEKIQNVMQEQVGVGGGAEKEFSIEKLLAEAHGMGILTNKQQKGGNGNRELTGDTSPAESDPGLPAGE